VPSFPMKIWVFFWELLIAYTIWNGIIEKMERRLVGWKRLYQSKRGRLTLIYIYIYIYKF
jgi:hypothetical protein